MKWKKWLENWNMTSLIIKAPFMEMEWNPSEPDKDAAWEMYIELATRITTQKLNDEEGTEQKALESVYELFPITREILKKYGREAEEFAKLAILILNQIIRPFTAKWHKISEENSFKNDTIKKEFRKELNELQEKLKIYTNMLAQMAGVESLIDINLEG
jgi:hypothetical protein